MLPREQEVFSFLKLLKGVIHRMMVKLVHGHVQKGLMKVGIMVKEKGLMVHVINIWMVSMIMVKII